MNFVDYRDEMVEHFRTKMAGSLLLRTAATGDDMWELYLGAFAPEHNKIFRERREHDCSACRQFIKHAGNMVAAVGNELVSLWDFVPSDPVYKPVNLVMSLFVKMARIENLMLSPQPLIGTRVNHEASGETVFTWNHLYVGLPETAVIRDKTRLQAALAKHRESHEMVSRALGEIKLDAIVEVIDLIKQNSLYRGEEHLRMVEKFHTLKVLYLAAVATDPVRSGPDTSQRRAAELFLWNTVATDPGLCRVRNTVIGTLLTDLSADVDLEIAVSSYESKVAPHNYKRPKSIVTKAMVERASKTMDELGYKSALARRHARLTDLTVNNMLFVDRESRMIMDPFEALAAELPVQSMQNLGKAEEVTIDKFLTDVLPTAHSLEIMFENRHMANLVSLLAPQDPDAPGIFRWPNNFSWCYAGGVTDSIKERVKAAGGNVTGFFRASLSWSNHDDLDLSIKEPSGNLIYFGNKCSRQTGGRLDVDMNAGGAMSRQPVENIVYQDEKRLPSGMYEIWVHQYRRRENMDVGFEVEIEINGEAQIFGYAKDLAQNERVLIARAYKNPLTGKLELQPQIASSMAQRTAWGLKTGVFHKVRLVCSSPNFWNGMKAGNEHWFFVLSGCATDQPARGFFNEFLKSDLTEHRKVLEILAGRMAAEPVPEQLSGLGFSSTRRDKLTVMVKGSFNRILTVLF